MALMTPRIEPRQLRLHTRKISGDAWLSGAQEPDWHQVSDEPDALETLSALPDGSQKGVALWWALNYIRGAAERMALVRDALRAVEAGGIVAAVAHCCDSGIKLLRLLEKAGILVDTGNLTNKEIAMLRPHDAVYLESHRIFAAGRDVKANDCTVPDYICNTLRGTRYPTGHQMEFSFPDKFTVGLLEVGLTWVKQ